VEQQTQSQNPKNDESNSLEAGASAVISDAADPNNQTTIVSEAKKDDTPKAKLSPKNRAKNFFKHLNIYFLLLILLLLVAGVIAFVSFKKTQESAVKVNLGTEPLSQEALNQLKQSDVRVGEPKQTLTVEANAIFTGKVFIKDDLEVAGKLKIGGPIDISDVAVTGSSNFDQLEVNSIGVANNATIQGQLTVQKSLNVAGSLSVGGLLSAAQLNISNLQVSGTLSISGHIDAGGGTPGKISGGALGSGGTSSISGSDTAGTVSINTGSGAGAGCFATVVFTKAFSGTPHVVITPVGSPAGSLNYYINRSSANFSICTTNTPPSGKNFAFDYIVID
jgi:cytoskeletal protein CcmA (bactofilin family)